MKYFHIYDTAADFEADFYSNSTGSTQISAILVQDDGDYLLYYDEERSDPANNVYRFFDKEGTCFAISNTLNIEEYSTDVTFGYMSNTAETQELTVYEVITKLPKNNKYEKPWVSVIRESGGSSQHGIVPTFNRKPLEVDLGLPSGLIWASCNVGACSPEEAGDYFAWGEIRPKTNYTWDTYKYGPEGEHTKYTYGEGGDNKYTLDNTDDAAYMNLGDGWRMPTSDEYEEMRYYTEFYADFIRGVPVLKAVSKENGNILYIPQWGSILGTEVTNVSHYGRYWTKNMTTGGSYYGIVIGETPLMFGWCSHGYGQAMVHDGICTRQMGCPVRAVKEPRGYVPFNPGYYK